MTEGGLIEFWFDFSSPYAFFAAREVEDIAAKHRARTKWQPFLLGPAFKATGMQSLSRTPIRGDYARHDWRRLARRAGIPFAIPPFHPTLSLASARLFYWLDAGDPAMAVRFARRAFDAYYLEGIDMSQAGLAVPVAAELTGHAPDVLSAGLADPAIKDTLRRKTEEAIARGIFGSPFFVVDGEPFWGADRLPMIDDWLASGGW